MQTAPSPANTALCSWHERWSSLVAHRSCSAYCGWDQPPRYAKPLVFVIFGVARDETSEAFARASRTARARAAVLRKNFLPESVRKRVFAEQVRILVPIQRISVRGGNVLHEMYSSDCNRQAPLLVLMLYIGWSRKSSRGIRFFAFLVENTIYEECTLAGKSHFCHSPSRQIAKFWI